MINKIIEKLPFHYRYGLSERIILSIRQNRPINIVGMPDIGKSIYINFFIKQSKAFFNDQVDRNFVQLSLKNLNVDSINSFEKEVIGSNYDDTVSAQYVVVIKGIDQLEDKVFRDISDYLLSLRQYPKEYRYIFLSHRPINERYDNPVLNSRLFNSIEFFLPETKADFQTMLKIYEEELGLSAIPEDRVKKYYDLSGGHIGLMKAILSYEKEIDILEQIKKTIPNDLKLKCEEITHRLTQKELEVLKQVSRGLISHNIETQNLVNQGYIIENNGQLTVFSQLLALILDSGGLPRVAISSARS